MCATVTGIELRNLTEGSSRAPERFQLAVFDPYFDSFWELDFLQYSYFKVLSSERELNNTGGEKEEMN